MGGITQDDGRERGVVTLRPSTDLPTTNATGRAGSGTASRLRLLIEAATLAAEAAEAEHPAERRRLEAGVEELLGAADRYPSYRPIRARQP